MKTILSKFRSGFLCAVMVVFAVIAPGPALCADEQPGPVVVASKRDTEGLILGRIIAEALKASGINVEERIGSGDTVELRRAIKAGEIDIYPEYVGLGALMYPATEAKVWRNSEEAFQALTETDHMRNGLIWLKAAPADAGWRIACRRDFALEHGLKTMVDFAGYVADGGEVKLACCESFRERADVLPAFQGAYGFMLEAEDFVMLDSCDTARAEELLSKGDGGVNFAMAFGTDAGVEEFRLVLLDDVKNSQISYQPSPVARLEVVEEFPQLKQILIPVFGALAASTMQSLNAAVAHGGMSPEQAAKAYLQSHGFIK